ncbi:MAG: CPBP family intramembrane glutamic endopeptidase [Planctomycetota bacterium]
MLTSIMVVIWVAARWPDVRPGLARLQASWCVMAALLAVPTFLLASVVLLVLVRVLEVPYIDFSAPIMAAGQGFAVVVLLICLQPAVIEELAFRGLILSALRDLLSDRDAIMVSAVMFMIIHCSVLSLPHLLTLGLVLAWLRVRTGSLWPGIVLHFGHNFLVVLGEQFGVFAP